MQKVSKLREQLLKLAQLKSLSDKNDAVNSPQGLGKSPIVQHTGHSDEITSRDSSSTRKGGRDMYDSNKENDRSCVNVDFSAEAKVSEAAVLENAQDEFRLSQLGRDVLVPVYGSTQGSFEGPSASLLSQACAQATLEAASIQALSTAQDGITAASPHHDEYVSSKESKPSSTPSNVARRDHCLKRPLGAQSEGVEVVQRAIAGHLSDRADSALPSQGTETQQCMPTELYAVSDEALAAASEALAAPGHAVRWSSETISESGRNIAHATLSSTGLPNHHDSTARGDSTGELVVNMTKQRGRFRTASGKHVAQVSDEALKMAHDLFATVDLLDIEEPGAEHLHTSISASKSQESTERDSVHGSRQNQRGPHPPMGGFQTASNKKVSVSSASLAKARKMLADADEGPMATTKPQQDQSEGKTMGGFRTASNKKVSVSSASLAKARKMLADADEGPTTAKLQQDQSKGKAMGGFRTASNKKVSVSSASLAKARKLLADAGERPTPSESAPRVQPLKDGGETSVLKSCDRAAGSGSGGVECKLISNDASGPEGKKSDVRGRHDHTNIQACTVVTSPRKDGVRPFEMKRGQRLLRRGALQKSVSLIRGYIDCQETHERFDPESWIKGTFRNDSELCSLYDPSCDLVCFEGSCSSFSFIAMPSLSSLHLENITSYNSGDLCFPAVCVWKSKVDNSLCTCKEMYGVPSSQVADDNAWCIGTFAFGWKTVRGVLLSLGCDSQRCSEEWAYNAYRIVVYILRSSNSKKRRTLVDYLDQGSSSTLSFGLVVRCMLARFRSEWEGSQSVLQRIVQCDESAQIPMNLMVMDVFDSCAAQSWPIYDHSTSPKKVQSSPPGAECVCSFQSMNKFPRCKRAVDRRLCWTVKDSRGKERMIAHIELTDGFYTIPAMLDATLLKALKKNFSIHSGSLILSCFGELVDRNGQYTEEGKDPLCNKGSIIRLHSNSTFLADEAVPMMTLGSELQRHPHQVLSSPALEVKWNRRSRIGKSHRARAGRYTEKPSSEDSLVGTVDGISLHISPSQRLHDSRLPWTDLDSCVNGGGTIASCVLIVLRRFPMLYYKPSKAEGKGNRRGFRQHLNERAANELMDTIVREQHVQTKGGGRVHDRNMVELSKTIPYFQVIVRGLSKCALTPCESCSLCQGDGSTDRCENHWIGQREAVLKVWRASEDTYRQFQEGSIVLATSLSAKLARGDPEFWSYRHSNTSKQDVSKCSACRVKSALVPSPQRYAGSFTMTSSCAAEGLHKFRLNETLLALSAGPRSTFQTVTYKIMHPSLADRLLHLTAGSETTSVGVPSSSPSQISVSTVTTHGADLRKFAGECFSSSKFRNAERFSRVLTHFWGRYVAEFGRSSFRLDTNHVVRGQTIDFVGVLLGWAVEPFSENPSEASAGIAARRTSTRIRLYFGAKSERILMVDVIENDCMRFFAKGALDAMQRDSYSRSPEKKHRIEPPSRALLTPVRAGSVSRKGAMRRPLRAPKSAPGKLLHVRTGQKRPRSEPVVRRRGTDCAMKSRVWTLLNLTYCGFDEHTGAHMARSNIRSVFSHAATSAVLGLRRRSRFGVMGGSIRAGFLDYALPPFTLTNELDALTRGSISDTVLSSVATAHASPRTPNQTVTRPHSVGERGLCTDNDLTPRSPMEIDEEAVISWLTTAEADGTLQELQQRAEKMRAGKNA